MTSVESVPLTISGVVVGTARINANGTIEIDMIGPSDLGKEIAEYIKMGAVSSLSIAPVANPTAQGVTIARLDLPVSRAAVNHIRNSVGVQFGNGNNQANAF